MVIRKKAVENEILIEKIWFFLKQLDLEYSNISNYILAFIHRSVVNEKPDYTPNHNERLEFLGDAVLELIITESLYKDFWNKTEWELTDIRSALVRWRNLAQISKKLKLNDNLLLWKWEEISWWRNNDYLLANTLEALIWAIYLDFWIAWAKKFIDKHIYSTLESILDNNLTKDFKTSIQEFAQANYDITPSYKVLKESWPDHNKIFKVWIYLNKKEIWLWEWTSKKKAQEEAAKNAYILLNQEVWQQ